MVSATTKIEKQAFCLLKCGKQFNTVSSSTHNSIKCEILTGILHRDPHINKKKYAVMISRCILAQAYLFIQKKSSDRSDLNPAIYMLINFSLKREKGFDYLQRKCILLKLNVITVQRYPLPYLWNTCIVITCRDIVKYIQCIVCLWVSERERPRVKWEERKCTVSVVLSNSSKSVRLQH